MLLSLHIENMAVIAAMDVDFPKGLSVITGETGAGKSVMIDSLLFLLGGKPQRDLVRSGTEKATVSAVFGSLTDEVLALLNELGFDPGEELMLQRTLTADGKSQCRLDGRVIPQGILREISRRLVNIHGQNDNQLLLSLPAQAKILDASADLGDLPAKYRAAYGVYSETRRALEELQKNSAEKERLRDILRFQIGEIDAAHLKPGEEEALVAKRGKLQNAEKISKQCEFTYHVLYGSEKGAAALLLERAAGAMNSLSAVIPEAGEMAAKLSEMRYEVEDIANTARDFVDENEKDPTAALNRVEERLDLISKFCRKYGKGIPEVLAFREKAAGDLHLLENKEDAEAELTAKLRESKAEMRCFAAELHELRAKEAAALSGQIREELAFLDMPGVRFEIRVRETGEYEAAGDDDVAFLLSANPGEPLLPLERVASGGELARVMLTLQSVLNAKDGVGTAVFDEVDTGISGKTARKIGIRLAEIGKQTQVLCVTHSAQIASLAGAHYKIEKHSENDRVFTTVRQLNDEERVGEVARILGGLSVTKAQTDAAAEIIEEGKAYR